MEVKKILWPTDFSRIAEKALPHVKSLTERYGAEIHVLYVIEDVAHHDGWYGAFEEKRVQELMEHAGKTATKRLGQICEKYLDGCPLYIKHVAVGDPAQEILKLIDAEKVDIVVMASHGEKGHFRFGSVTEKVLKNSAIPVTIIPVAPAK
ncbi:MAG: universal stress protein [Deltaproteobacteria bacterium]|nr:universal stress protein [Deltaproteobacteria bacterium]